MRFITIFKYISILTAVLLAISVFLPWVVIETRGITITGMDTGETDFGKPGYFHLFMAAAFLILTFTPRIWAKRLNLLITALNLAWAIRNFFIIPACSGGECPDKQAGIYIILIGSLVMLVASLFPDIDLDRIKKTP